MAKPGRKSEYEQIGAEEVCRRARQLCSFGATDDELAEHFQVSARAIYRWKNAYPEFAEALDEAKTEADSKVEKSLFQRALGYSHPELKVFQNGGDIITHEVMKHYPPDATSMIFWLKNRKPVQWRDKVENDMTVRGHFTVSDEPMELDDWDNKYALGAAARPSESTD